jgi:hypothetical protein
MEDITNIISAIAAVMVAFIAWKGLNTWKEQLRGNAEYENGRKLLSAVYKIRNTVDQVRNPFASAGEIGSALKAAGYDVKFRDDDYHWKSQQALYLLRWNKVLEAITELDLAALEAEVFWGKDITEKLDILRRLLHKLIITINAYIKELEHPRRRDITEEEIMETNGILYALEKSANEGYSADFSEAIKQIEDFIRERLRLGSNKVFKKFP